MIEQGKYPNLTKKKKGGGQKPTHVTLVASEGRESSSTGRAMTGCHTKICGFKQGPMDNSQKNITERNNTLMYLNLSHGSTNTVLDTQD